MMINMGRREEKKRQTQTRILEVAMPPFVDRGYERCTIDDIVKAAGIARGTFIFTLKTSLLFLRPCLMVFINPLLRS